MPRSGTCRPLSDPVGHRPGDAGYRRLIVALFFAGIATFAQIWVTQGVLPILAADFAISPATAALSVSVCTLGVAGAVIPWSWVADRIGRVPAIGIGVLTATVLGSLVPFMPAIGPLLAVRLMEGVALGAVPAVALALLTEEVHPRHVASAAGSYIAGTTVGGLSGRLVAGPVGDANGWHAGVWSVMAMCLASGLVFVLLVPRARGFVAHRRRTTTGPSIVTRLWTTLRSGRQLAICAQGFLLMGGFVAMYNYLGFRLTAPPLSLPTSVASLVFLAYLAGTVSSPLAGVWATRRGRPAVLLAGIVTMTAGALLTLLPHVATLIAGMLVFTAGFFAAHAVASGWASAAATPETRAQASSLYYLGYYGGSGLFGWCLGFIYDGVAWAGLITGIVLLCAVSATLAITVLRQRG